MIIKRAISVILLSLLLSTAYAVSTPVITAKVYGMTCQFCAYGLKKKLSGLDGVKRVRVSLRSKQAVIFVKPNYPTRNLLKSVKKAIIDAGYTPKQIIIGKR